MIPNSEESLEAWIESRKPGPATNLTASVMQAIQDKSPPPARQPSRPEPPSWFVALGCLLAGLGKLSLVCHLAF